MKKFLKRTWAEVNLDYIDENYRSIKSRLKPETKVCCVIKADAYGHGAQRLALEYEKLGADWFAVSNLEEAEQIRRTGVDRPILLLGYTPPCMAEELAHMNIAQAVFSSEYAEELSNEAVKAGVTVRAHIKLDTGMSRIGFLYQDPERDAAALDCIEKACKYPGLDAEGIFTHFAVADEGTDGRDYTLRQFGNLKSALEKLEKRGCTFRIRHCANSAAIFDYPELQLDMVRPGVILYGLMPSGKIRNPAPLKPALELKSVVALVKKVEPQTTVSYGRMFTADRPTAIATVPIGYADGYSRKLYEKASMLVHGKRAKIVGRVCMDQLMLDVTNIPGVREGDIVTVIGGDGGERIPVEELTDILGTINYEFVCDISKRVPRLYFQGGREVGSLNYISR